MHTSDKEAGGRVRGSSESTIAQHADSNTSTLSKSTASNPPASKPKDPRFSSGPCRKHPGWNLKTLSTQFLGRSHRASGPKQRLGSAIDRSAKLMGLPVDWKLAIVPGSDTGAFEMALWNFIGHRPVDALVWDAFSADWAKDLKALNLAELNVYESSYGELPDLTKVRGQHDVVFAYNGTTSGVRVPDLNWLDARREGLVLCDATSIAFAQELDFSKLDVVTWSWQKILGSEAAHGMLALSPKAVARLETQTAPRATPKLFTLTKNGKLNSDLFTGSTINTPSLLAVEDLHSALNWAESIGGMSALQTRTEANFQTVDNWVAKHHWIDWLATIPSHRSHTALCLQIVHPTFTDLPKERQQAWVKQMVSWLDEANVAFDIANYRSAPPGFRLWGGPTIDADEYVPVLLWIEWAFNRVLATIDQEDNQYA